MFMQEQNQHPVLRVEHLDIKFNLRGKVLHAIRDVSLELYEGETLADICEYCDYPVELVLEVMGDIDE